MLKQNTQKNIKQQKLFQSALKHKVRNLRAKVQTLLPIHLCQKIAKRGSRLQKQYLKKKFIQYQLFLEQASTQHQNNENSKKWKFTYNTNKRQPNFFEQSYQKRFLNRSQKVSTYKNSCNCCDDDFYIGDDQKDNNLNIHKSNKKNNQLALKGYHFQRLTDDQIEQIQEDKLYYLGTQQHIKAYQSYIKQKYTIKSTIPISKQVYKSVSKSTIAIGTNKYLKFNPNAGSNTSFDSQNFMKHPNFLLQNKNYKKNYQKANFNQQSRKNNNPSLKTTSNQNRLFRNTTNQRFFNSTIQQNLVRINQQEHIKRILLAMELKSKHERVQQNFSKIKNHRRQAIQLENFKQYKKIVTAQQKKRKIYNQVGQIVDLTEQLRKKCIERKKVKSRQNNKNQKKNQEEYLDELG